VPAPEAPTFPSLTNLRIVIFRYCTAFYFGENVQLREFSPNGGSCLPLAFQGCHLEEFHLAVLGDLWKKNGKT
jgi:hypothetical protein